MSLVKSINDAAEFQRVISGNGDASKLTVVDFTATWCGPCQMMKPVFMELSTRFRHVTFCTVDVDALQDVAGQYGVNSMPTFLFFKNSAKVDEMKGANPGGLTQKVEQLQGPSDAPGVSGAPTGHSDLTDYVTMAQLHCLNQSSSNGVKNAFMKGPAYLESDVDGQLLIGIEFNQAVKLHSMRIIAPKEFAPKVMKTYLNRQSLGFDEAETVKETERFDLTAKDFEEGSLINLRYVRYQSVTAITLFVDENLEDSDVTRIQQIIFYGTPVETTKDVATFFKKDGPPSGSK